MFTKMKRNLLVLMLIPLLMMGLVPATGATPPSGPVTIEVVIDYSAIPFSGDFVVTEGDGILGCVSGTFAVLHLGVPAGDMQKVFMCESGGVGTFTFHLFEPGPSPGPGDANGHWEALSGTDDFSGIGGQGDYSAFFTGPLNGEVTLTGVIHFDSSNTPSPYPTAKATRAGDQRIPDKAEFLTPRVILHGTGDDRYYQGFGKAIGMSLLEWDGTLYLYYGSGSTFDPSANNDARNRKLLLATSTDGGDTWDKQGIVIDFDPATHDPGFAGAGSPSPEEGVFSAHVFVDPLGSFVAFVSEMGNSNAGQSTVNTQIGLWTSSDGIGWSRQQTIFASNEPGLLGADDEVWIQNVWRDQNGRYHMFYMGNAGVNSLYHVESSNLDDYTNWNTSSDELVAASQVIAHTVRLSETELCVGIKSAANTVYLFVVDPSNPVPLGTINKTWNWGFDQAAAQAVIYWSPNNQKWITVGGDGPGVLDLDIELYRMP